MNNLYENLKNLFINFYSIFYYLDNYYLEIKN